MRSESIWIRSGSDEADCGRTASEVSIPVVVSIQMRDFREEGGKTVYDIDPPEFVEEMKGMLEMGVSAVGAAVV